MSNYRDTVAAAMHTVLLGHTAAGQNVHTRLDRPLDPRTDLPAILVYANHARRGQQDYGNSLIPRMVTVVMEFAVQDTPANALDAVGSLVAQAEALIEADPSLGHVVNNCKWQQAITDTTSHGEFTMGVGLLEYEVEILTNERQPGAFGVGDDGFDGVPDTVFTVPNTTAPVFNPMPVPGDDVACGPDGCDLPAWGGEVQP